mmetsp:Transcript_14016/g.27328  ORF Transcript_14016/g.27328 Transcript_14016/m.27328 type:complete len:84 (+) Transcript_14016:174-425(+)
MNWLVPIESFTDVGECVALLFLREVQSTNLFWPSFQSTTLTVPASVVLYRTFMFKGVLFIAGNHVEAIERRANRNSDAKKDVN